MNYLIESVTPVSFNELRQLTASSESKPYLSCCYTVGVEARINIEAQIQKFGKIMTASTEKEGYSEAPLVSEEVVINAIKFVESLPNEVLHKFSIADLTPTNYGTIVLDWYDADENTVSIEIGTTKIGGFYNFDNEAERLDEELISNLYLSGFKFINIINRLYKSQLEAYG